MSAPRATGRRPCHAIGRPIATALALGLAATGALLAGALPALAQTAAADDPERLSLAELLNFEEAPSSVRRALYRAQTLRQRDQDEEAEAVLQSHLEDHPDQDHALIRFHLGYLLMQRGESAAALPHLRRAVILDPRLWPAWQGLGEAAFAEGEFAEGAEAFTQTYRRMPDPVPELLHYAAVGWLQADQPVQAQPLTEELVSGRVGSPSFEWYRTHVAVASALERPELARAAVDEVVLRFPDDPDAWILAYQQAAAANDLERAVLNLQLVGYLRPFDRNEMLQLGDLYRAVSAPAAAAPLYAEALADSASAVEYERLISAHLAAHQRSEALAVLDRALVARPTPRLWSLKGDVHYLDGDYEAALAAFDRAAEALADTAAAGGASRGRPHLMMGYCAWELGRRDEAIAHLRRALEFADQEDAARRALRRIGEVGDGG